MAIWDIWNEGGEFAKGWGTPTWNRRMLEKAFGLHWTSNDCWWWYTRPPSLHCNFTFIHLSSSRPMRWFGRCSSCFTLTVRALRTLRRWWDSQTLLACLSLPASVSSKRRGCHSSRTICLSTTTWSGGQPFRCVGDEEGLYLVRNMMGVLGNNKLVCGGCSGPVGWSCVV